MYQKLWEKWQVTVVPCTSGHQPLMLLTRRICFTIRRLTLSTLTWVFIFFTLYSIHLPRCCFFHHCSLKFYLCWLIVCGRSFVWFQNLKVLCFTQQCNAKKTSSTEQQRQMSSTFFLRLCVQKSRICTSDYPVYTSE